MKTPGIMNKPLVIGILSIFAGFILGLIWGWVIQPVQWKDADPSYLALGYQEDYLRMAIDSYAVNPDAGAALNRYQAVGVSGIDTLKAIASQPGNQDPVAIMNFINIVQPGGLVTTSTSSTQDDSDMTNTSTSYLIIGAIILVIGFVGYLLARLLRPLVNKSGERTPAQEAQQISNQTEKTNFAELKEEQPIFQMMNTYVLGDDLYTHSMDINSADGTYLGQCGLEIADTIPVFDKPKRVRAIAVWLFGLKYKETIWAILMPPDSYDNETLRDRLRVKGEPIKVDENLVVEIETRELKMHVRVVKVEYGQGSTPDEDYYKNLTLELAVWPKVVNPN